MSASIDTIRPRSEAETLDAMRAALADGNTLEIVAGGTKCGLGHPVNAAALLDLSELAGETAYDPSELVLTISPSVKLAEVTAMLAGSRQRLAFEPPDLGPLLGAPAGQGTLGGVLATNLSGPRRPFAGAARDHLLGCRAISGCAEIFVSGSRVVKNVTGYDLPKLLAGSFGTLAVLTSVNVKTLPQPEASATVRLPGLDSAQAVQAMQIALGGPFDVSGAAWLPTSIAAHLDLPEGPATLLRLEGVAVSVADRARMLSDKLSGFASPRLLDRDHTEHLWAGIRDVRPFVNSPGCVWRLSIPPAEGAAVLARLRATLGDIAAYLDWGGGLIWLNIPSPMAREVRSAIADCGGHATLIRAPASDRAALDVFQPLSPGLRALNQRVKVQFDPQNLLNPGRMIPAGRPGQPD